LFQPDDLFAFVIRVQDSGPNGGADCRGQMSASLGHPSKFVPPPSGWITGLLVVRQIWWLVPDHAGSNVFCTTTQAMPEMDPVVDQRKPRK